MKKTIVQLVLALALCGTAMAQEMSLSTNVADYISGGTLNMEAAYGFARHWSVSAGAKYNPFTFGEGDGEIHLKQRSVSAGARYWPWHIYSGWWMGAGLKYQEFNRGGITSPETMEGDRYGAGLSAGYSRMLGKHLNLDLGMGVWAGYGVYTTYSCPTCGRKLDSGNKAFVLPNDMILGINYIF